MEGKEERGTDEFRRDDAVFCIKSVGFSTFGCWIIYYYLSSQ